MAIAIITILMPAQILANPADEYVARFVQDKRRQIQMADEGAFVNGESMDEIPGKGVMDHISRES